MLLPKAKMESAFHNFITTDYNIKNTNSFLKQVHSIVKEGIVILDSNQLNISEKERIKLKNKYKQIEIETKNTINQLTPHEHNYTKGSSIDDLD